MAVEQHFERERVALLDALHQRFVGERAQLAGAKAEGCSKHHPLPGISPEARVQQFSSSVPSIRITFGCSTFRWAL